MTQRPILTICMKRNPVLDDPNVGASDVCMDCRNDLAAFTTGWQLCETCRLARLKILVSLFAPKGQPQSRAFDQALDLWTIEEYVDWLNGHDNPRVHGGLMREASDWVDYGITTARGVAEHLDACVEREREKDMGW
jgi:hypothetical protein